MESPDGFGGLYLCRYGDYFVAMNASAEKNYAVPLPPEMAQSPQTTPLKDLISGHTYLAGQLTQLGPRSTMVLRPKQRGAEVVIKHLIVSGESRMRVFTTLSGKTLTSATHWTPDSANTPASLLRTI